MKMLDVERNQISDDELELPKKKTKLVRRNAVYDLRTSKRRSSVACADCSFLQRDHENVTRRRNSTRRRNEPFDADNSFLAKI